MGIRSTLAGLVAGPARRALEGDIRELIEQALAARSFARAADVAALREQVAGRRDEALQAEVTALKARVDGLEKQLSMAMGGLQAVTTDLVGVRGLAEGASTAARQAGQQATTARSTAEAAADGVAGVESQVAKLIENLGTAKKPATRARKTG